MPVSVLDTSAARQEFSEGTVEVDGGLQAVLDALQDPDNRCILRAVADQPRTVAELTGDCDLPRTTAYRKVDRLVEASLLEAQTRIRTEGHHVQQYAPLVSGVHISFDEEQVALTVAEVPPATAD